MRFEYPLVLSAIPVLMGLLYYFTRPRSIISFCLRSLIIILLVFMVAGFRAKAQPENTCRIYLIDDSASVFLDKDRLLATINENIKQLGLNDTASILYLNQTDDKTLTNIEKGLVTARNTFPSGYRKEIFLFSDGNQTEGDVIRIRPSLKDEGITLYTIPIGPKDVVDIRIDSVEAPKFVRAGQPIELKCRISSTVNASADFQVYRDKVLIKKSENIKLLANQDNSIVVNLPPQVKPIEIYKIKVLAPGLNEITLENNVWQEMIQKTGKLKILYISEHENQLDRTIPRIIKSNNNFEIDTIHSSKPAGRFLYDIIVLDDISMIDEIAPVIESFVSNGRGILVLGGQNSFGLGGYQNTGFERILPVYASPAEDLSLVIIQDASGSMDEISGIAGQTKYQVASEALQDSVALLSRIDRLEVIAFNQGYQTVLPLQNADNIISKLKDKLVKVKPTGPTAILPPLQQALATLNSVSSAKKHIILLSDGYSTTNEALDGFKQIAEKLQQNHITVSVIATGEHINEETLKTLTKDGGLGKVYRLNSRDKDSLTRNLKEDLSINKEFFRQVESLPVDIHIKYDVLKGINDLPAISGYNRTTLKPNARLVVSLGDKEPLLADWQYGLGRAMVLTTSLDSHWRWSWNRWAGLGQMITQALRYLSADIAQNQLSDISTEKLADGRIKLSIGAPDNLELDAQVEPLAEKITDTQTVRLAQVAVGKYEGILPAQEEGVIISVLTQKVGRPQLLGRIPVVKQYAREWRRFTPDMEFLRNLAESTNGKLLTVDEFTKGQTPGASAGKSGNTYRNINAILILAVLGLFLLDMLIRR